MAVTPRQVKTLTEEELQWMKTQLQAIDQDVYIRYDGTNPLEIVLEHDDQRRAFVNEAFFRRAVSEYARSGWQIEDGGPRGSDRILFLCDAQASSPFDVAHIAKQNQPAPAWEEKEAQSAQPRAEGDGPAPTEEALSAEVESAEDVPREVGDLDDVTPMLEGESGLEEEVETLWGTGEDDEEDKEEKVQPQGEESGLRVELLESSFALLAPSAEQLVERFYEKLLADYPEVDPLFADVDMEAQKKHLINALVLTVNNLRSPQKLKAALTALGKRHQRYGVESSHYLMVGGTLLCVMEEFAGEAWTADVQEAWEQALDQIGIVMLAAYEPAP